MWAAPSPSPDRRWVTAVVGGSFALGLALAPAATSLVVAYGYVRSSPLGWATAPIRMRLFGPDSVAPPRHRLPSVFFPESDEVDETDDDDRRPRWNLLVVEDADELLRADARSAPGQALSRLLNLADGFIGQGLDVLILLSPNERLGGLTPAVSRPGRCLSEIQFPRFSRQEAASWLGRELPTDVADASLAELVRARDHADDDPVTPFAAPANGVGQYL